MLDLLATASLGLALLPLILTAWNLVLYRPPPPARGRPAVSVLIPARDEEANIEAAIRSVLASRGTALELIVLDDHSTDRTRDIAEAIARQDDRLRVVAAPPLPPGWSGKQHACHVLSRHAAHERLLFMDADVRLSSDAVARIAAALDGGRAGLVSGFPRLVTHSLAEQTVIPLVIFLLLGYLPMWAMRRYRMTGFGVGCGQLMMVRATAYHRAGGHGAIRASLHDGVTLPRAFRRSGTMTDLVDLHDLASCRMYAGWRQVWSGFAKNATEGMATPVALPAWMVLLGGGQVLPFVLLLLGAATAASVVPEAAAAAAAVYGTRLLLATRVPATATGIILHPVGICVVLAIQCYALWAALAGRAPTWRGRSYRSS